MTNHRLFWDHARKSLILNSINLLEELHGPVSMGPKNALPKARRKALERLARARARLARAAKRIQG